MPQLHFYVPDSTAAWLRARAKARGLPLSRYLAEILTQTSEDSWPEGFFKDVVGGWQGEPLRRPPQGKLKRRDLF